MSSQKVIRYFINVLWEVFVFGECVLLFETSSDLQPIMRFNIITRSKCYSLFPILSGLVEPYRRPLYHSV